MLRNRFTAKLVLRIIVLLGNMVLITVAAKQPLEKQILFTLGGLCFLLILQIIMLFEFLNRTNRNLLRFFMIIFDSDYFTKKEGSGIGLSFSRQIMQLHGGSITVQSIPVEETVFTLRF